MRSLAALGAPLGAIVTGLALRLATLAAYYVRSGGRWETWEYEVAAQNLLAGKGFVFQDSITLSRSPFVPVFPILCASLHWAGGPGLWLYFCVQLALAAVFILAVYSLGNALLGPRAGLWAAFLAAVEPGLIVYQSYKVDVALLTMTLMVLSFLGLLRAARRDSFGAALWSGAVGGIAALTRPDAVALLALPPLAFFLIGPKRMSLRTPLAFALGFALTVLPWFVRGYRIHHRILITSGSTRLLWAGNNPRSTGTSWTREGTPIFNAVPDDWVDYEGFIPRKLPSTSLPGVPGGTGLSENSAIPQWASSQGAGPRRRASRRRRPAP